MTVSSRIATAALAGAMLSLGAPRPAAADGGASTRNILFGAAAVGGALLVINHNKKVHQKYAEYDQRQAQTQSEANQAEAAYESEKQAYSHEVAIVSEYQKEVAYQHKIVHQKDAQLASLEHSLLVAKAGRSGRVTAYVPVPRHYALAPKTRASRPRQVVAERRAEAPQVVSYGWGTY